MLPFANMPDSPETPSRRERPALARSQSADPRLSPPEKTHHQLSSGSSTAGKLLTGYDPFQESAKSSDPALATSSSSKRHLHFHHHIIPHFHPHGHHPMHATTARLKHAGEKLQENALIPSFLHTSSSQQFDSKSTSADVSRTVTRTTQSDHASSYLSQPLLSRRHQIGVDDVIRERRKRERRDRELSNTFSYLNDEAHQASRQLDFTYYTILEKVAALRSTIGNLQDLYKSARQLHNNFVSDTQELQTATEEQLRGFHDFEEQKSSVEELESRVKHSKKRTDELSKRLETARQRVETWEKREAQWQRKVGLRLRIFYCSSFCLCILVVLLLILRQLAVGQKEAPMQEIQGKLSNTSFVSIAMEILASGASSLVQPLTTASAPLHKQTPDSRLDIFDEL